MSKKAISISVVIILALWAVLSLAVDMFILPTPWKVIYTLLIDLPDELGFHIAVSLWRILAGMMIATAVGVPLGLILGQNRKLDKYMFPFVYVTYPIPKVVLLPVVILFLGIGDISKIFLIALILFFQVLVIVRDASMNIPSEQIFSLRSLGANKVQLLRYLYLPACLPATLTSLRLSVAIAISVLYLAESFATSSGLGYYVMETWQRMSYERMYAGVMAMSLVGALAFIGLAYIEARICRWTQVGKAMPAV